MLKDSVLRAIGRAKIAAQDLLIEGFLIQRDEPTFVPGVGPQYVENRYDASLIPSKFEAKEIDGERIRATDVRYLMFPTDVDPQVNDIIEIVNDQYRIVDNDPIRVGDSIGLSQLQMRKL